LIALSSKLFNPKTNCHLYKLQGHFLGLKSVKVMKIDPITANDFIAVYREFLLDLYESSETEKVHKKLTEKLVIGRRQFAENRDLLKVFLEKNNKFNFPKETISAIENIEIAKWVYLRDTRYYSVLLNIDGLSGYGVLGLNDKIKEIVGQSGVVIETGVMPLKGNFVSDGLILSLADLGSNYKNEFNVKFRELKESKKFKTKANVSSQ